MCEHVYCVYCVYCVWACVLCVLCIVCFVYCLYQLCACFSHVRQLNHCATHSNVQCNPIQIRVYFCEEWRKHYSQSVVKRTFWISLSIQGHDLSNFVTSLRANRSWMSDCQKKMESGKFTESSDFYREHLPTLSKTSENGNLKSCRKSLQLTFFRWLFVIWAWECALVMISDQWKNDLAVSAEIKWSAASQIAAGFELVTW